jgi:hypothetical protein
MKIIANIENCESYHSVAVRTGVDRKSLRLCRAQKDEIAEVPNKRMVNRLPGCGGKPFIQDVDEELLRYFCLEHKARRSVTYKVLQDYAMLPHFLIRLHDDFGN